MALLCLGLEDESIAGQVGSLLVKIGSQFSGKGFREAESGTTRVTKAFTTMGAAVGVAIGSVVANLALNLGRALINTAKETIAFAGEFESSLAKIENLVGLSAETVGELGEALLKLGPEVGVGPRALADALFVVTSAGVEGAAALEIVEEAARASAIGLGETESVARAVTAAITAYGAENLSAADATRILALTVREGNLEAASLAPVLGRVIGIAAEMGVSFEQVGAAIATYTRLGVSAEEATTGLRATLSAMLNPGKEAKEALEKIGLSAEGLRKKIAGEGLQKTLVGLLKSFKDNKVEVTKFIPNVRALAFVLGTAKSQAKEYGNILGSVSSDTDIVNEGFERVSETLEFQQEQFAATAEAAKIAFGNVFVPVVGDAVTAASSLLTSFVDLGKAGGDLVEAFDEIDVPVGEFGEAIGEIDEFLKKLIDRIDPEFGKSMEALDGSLIKTVGKFNLFTLTLDNLTRGITDVVIPSIGALVGVQNWLNKQLGLTPDIVTQGTLSFEEYVASLEGVHGGTGDVIEGLDLLGISQADLGRITSEGTFEVAKFGEATEVIIPPVKELTEAQKDAAEKARLLAEANAFTARVVADLSEGTSFLAGQWEGLATVFDETKPSIELTGDALELLETMTGEAADAVHDDLTIELRTLGEQAVTTGETIETSLLGALNNLVRDIGQADIFSGVVNAVTDFGGFVQTFFAAGGPVGQGIAAGLQIFEHFGISVGDILGTVFSGFLETFGLISGGGGLSAAEQFIQNQVDTVREGLQALTAGLRDIAAEAFVTGDKSRQAADEIALLEKILIDMRKRGIDPSNVTFKKLTAALKTAKEGALLLSEVLLEGPLGVGLGQFGDNVGEAAEILAEIDRLTRSLATNLSPEQAQAIAAQIQALADRLRELRESADETGGSAEILQAIFSEVEEEFQNLSREAEALGDPFDEAAVRSGLLEDALRSYILAGGDNQIVIDAMVAAIDALSDSVFDLNEILITATPGEVIESIFSGIDSEVERLRLIAETLGLPFDEAEEKARLIEQAIRAYINAGGSNAEVLDALADALRGLNDIVGENADTVGDFIGTWSDLDDEISTVSIAGLVNAFGDLDDAADSAENAVGALTDALEDTDYSSVIGSWNDMIEELIESIGGVVDFRSLTAPAVTTPAVSSFSSVATSAARAGDQRVITGAVFLDSEELRESHVEFWEA